MVGRELGELSPALVEGGKWVDDAEISLFTWHLRCHCARDSRGGKYQGSMGRGRVGGEGGGGGKGNAGEEELEERQTERRNGGEKIGREM